MIDSDSNHFKTDLEQTRQAVADITGMVAIYSRICKQFDLFLEDNPEYEDGRNAVYQEYLNMNTTLHNSIGMLSCLQKRLDQLENK